MEAAVCYKCVRVKQPEHDDPALAPSSSKGVKSRGTVPQKSRFLHCRVVSGNQCGPLTEGLAAGLTSQEESNCFLWRHNLGETSGPGDLLFIFCSTSANRVEKLHPE